MIRIILIIVVIGFILMFIGLIISFVIPVLIFLAIIFFGIRFFRAKNMTKGDPEMINRTHSADDDF